MTATSEQEDRRINPPRPQLCLTLGITGHRASRMTDIATITTRIAEVVSGLQDAMERLDAQPWFREEPPRLRVMSALAEGADRIVADIAIAHGYELDAVVPFMPDEYAKDFHDQASHDHYNRLLTAAGRVLVLPGRRDPDSRAYALAGEALVAHSTIIIAVWDGAPALGRGGTGEVVARAVETNVPVIHIPIDSAQPIRVMWSPFEPFAVTTRNVGVVASRPWTDETLDRVLQQVLLPPDEPNDRAQLRQYLAETQHRRNYRVEYPLLLALTGTQPLRRSAWTKEPYRPATRREWADYRAAGGEFCAQNAEMLDLLEDAFSWADHLGTHYAQNLRGGHVVNFSFSALAVLVALASLVFPAIKLQLVLVEIAIIVTIIFNTNIGSRDAWQRRWLDYRILAERLRPLRSLKLLGVASPPTRPPRKFANARRWVDWYVTAVWREMGSPTGMIDAAKLDELRALIAEQELSGEIAYHHSNARRMAHLEKRLHKIGSRSFLATIIICAIFPFLYFTVHDIVMEYSKYFVALSAGLPALGGATYALRVHGDYAGAAGRSLETADALASIRSAMTAHGLPLALAAALTTAAARVMLVDLGEWQLTYEQRTLAIPG